MKLASVLGVASFYTLRVLLLVLLVLSLSACATPYQEKGNLGGYSETRLSENVFRVNFEGNVLIDRATVSDYALLRAAETVLEHGYSYFLVMDSDEYTERFSYTTPSPVSSRAFKSTVILQWLMSPPKCRIVPAFLTAKTTGSGVSVLGGRGVYLSYTPVGTIKGQLAFTV